MNKKTRKKPIAKVKVSRKPEEVKEPIQVEPRTERTQNPVSQEERQREENESTRRNKEIFLKCYKGWTGTIMDACKRAKIGRTAYYQWLKEDEEFKGQIEQLDLDKVDMTEGQLFKRIRKGDTSAIRFALQSLSPKYKPRSVIEHHVGDKTLEDLLDADKAKDNVQNTPTTDRGAPEDSQQA